MPRMRTTAPAGRRRPLADKLVAALNAQATGRSGDLGSCEFARTTTKVVSNVTAVLRLDNIPFDEITGSLPFGRVIEIYGLEGSGKSAIAIKAGVQAKLGNIWEKDPANEGQWRKITVDPDDVTVLYIDNEQVINDDEKMVVDGTEVDFVLGRVDTIDQMFKAIEKVIDDVRAFEAESGRKQYIVAVIDTVASTSSEQELLQKWGTDDYPRQAKQLRAGFRQMVRKISQQNVCMICLNQVSDTFAKKMGGRTSFLPTDADFSTFGGRALKFYASIRIFMFRLPHKYTLHYGGKFAAGFVSAIYTSKNKWGRKPLREVRAVMLFGNGNLEGGGWSSLHSMLETLIFLKFASVVEQGQGAISFNFRSSGVPTTTFENNVSLEEQATNSRRIANPTMDSRAEWPSFYESHKSDMDNLWAEAVKFLWENDTATSFDSDPDAESDDSDE